MKKYLFILPVLFITLFANVNKVRAENNSYTWSSFYNRFDEYAVLDTTYQQEVENLIDYYDINLTSTYDYYFITYIANAYFSGGVYYDIIIMYFLNSNQVYSLPGSSNPWDRVSIGSSSSFNGYEYIEYAFPHGTASGSTGSIRYVNASNNDSYNNHSYTVNWSPYVANFNLYLSPNKYDRVQIPAYDNANLDLDIPQLDYYPTDIIPTYKQVISGEYFDDYQEIDLNEYDYIILSLKNYNSTPFNTNIYTLGSLCLTPVYNYGMTERKDFYGPGSQVQPCTTIYSDFTPVLVSVSANDISNHAVYYIKAQNSNTNKIKVDTSKFNITYITPSTISPSVSIGGRSYPVIPYNDLTDTANISTEEGYIPGQSCVLGDINCQSRDMGMDITDLFTHPLELLQSLWSSITSVFVLITTFIGLLPITLQTFLYTAFMLAIILGILKIIL